MKNKGKYDEKQVKTRKALQKFRFNTSNFRIIYQFKSNCTKHESRFVHKLVSSVHFLFSVQVQVV